ncbi:HEPN domain-containing protein [Candidatus Cryosericum septentrionale]|uniref:Uncharacterized protein n=1 Tax=Candidatus Cryosericum septentrionale TaxID=2290913 RepID=A0A398DPF2_9BACT|nr:HEPN domain-containing protein [Candidatus Cryosericum septentrionale]RIE16103.1 hypothetical protein SMC1_08570 [Candidatus Cryosericum septentrionale]
MKDNEAGLATELLRIVNATKRAQFRFGSGCFMIDRESYEVGPEAIDSYRRFPWRLLMHSGAEEHFSLSAVGTMVSRSVARLVDGQATVETAEAELHGILQTLSVPPPEQTVLRELTGIELPPRTTPLALAGGKVARFTKRDRSRLLRQYREYARSVITKPQLRRSVADAMAPDLNDFVGKTVLWSTHAAEPIRAEELSLGMAHRVCTLLRYGCMSLRSDGNEMAIGIGSVQSTHCLIIPEEGFIQSSWARTGKSRSWTIKPPDRAGMRKAGVFVLSALYEESESGRGLPGGSFHSVLLQVLHWADVSLDQPDNSSRILALTVALETLFSYGASPVRSAVAEGTAMVISRNVAERKHISARIKKLYDKRSDVAHGRAVETLSLSDVREMENCVRLTIRVLCHHMDEFDSLDSFSEALATARLSGRLFRAR